MHDSQIGANVRYITNEAGERTDVLVPVAVWENLMSRLRAENGLHTEDEQEPIEQILTDLQVSLCRKNQREPIQSQLYGMFEPLGLRTLDC